MPRHLALGEHLWGFGGIHGGLTLAPSYAAILGALAPIPTVELTVRPSQSLAKASSPWVLLHARTRAASADGWIDEEIHAWGPDGTHLGSAQQLRLIRSG